MSKFSELYDADIARYGGKPEAYVKTFLFPDFITFLHIFCEPALQGSVESIVAIFG